MILAKGQFPKWLGELQSDAWVQREETGMTSEELDWSLYSTEVAKGGKGV